MIRVGDYQVTKEDEQSVLEVLRSNCLSEGKKVREFEEKWADFCGAKYAVLTNSGTSALLCCLEVMKSITKQRKVWTSPLTFIATINAIVLAGFEPVFSDVERDTFVLKPTLNRAGIFLPVHLYGYPTDMNEFSYSWMIEDACEAHGTLYKGKKVGSIGTMGVFSFYIAHNIQVGDMGAITTNNHNIYKLLKKVKAHGRMCECAVCRRNDGLCPHKDKDFDPRFTHTKIAYNFKTTEIQAALGLNQLKHAEEILQKRQENVKYLNEGLKGIDGLQLPVHDPTVSYLAYPVIINNLMISRDEFCRKLSNAGVENRPLFSCVPTQQPAYEHIREKWEGKLPNAEYLGKRGFHCGCHQYLTKQDLDFMIEAIKKTYEETQA
jgi:CDP-6-deoxy-D-xylo-4-hexulose-3-dehydrase